MQDAKTNTEVMQDHEATELDWFILELFTGELKKSIYLETDKEI